MESWRGVVVCVGIKNHNIVVDDLSFLRIAAYSITLPRQMSIWWAFVLLLLLNILTENIVCLSFRKENTTIYTLVFARAECRKLLLRVTVCVRRFTVPVGKVFSSSSRWSAAILMLLWEWKFGLQRSALSLEDRRSYFLPTWHFSFRDFPTMLHVLHRQESCSK